MTFVSSFLVGGFTLGHLSGEGGGNGGETELRGAVMHGHLPTLALVAGARVTLVHELVQGKTPVHEYAWKDSSLGRGKIGSFEGAPPGFSILFSRQIESNTQIET